MRRTQFLVLTITLAVAIARFARGHMDSMDTVLVGAAICIAAATLIGFALGELRRPPSS